LLAADNLFGNLEGFVVIDFSCHSDEPGFHRIISNNEVRINGNAMSSNPGSRLKNIHAGMLIVKVNVFPDIDIGFVADDGELIGKGNLHISGGILRQFEHLCRADIGFVKLSFYKIKIKIHRFFFVELSYRPPITRSLCSNS